jgi:hypothetical protein
MEDEHAWTKDVHATCLNNLVFFLLNKGHVQDTLIDLFI